MYACKKTQACEIHRRCSGGTVRFGRLNRLDVSRATDHDRSTYPSIDSQRIALPRCVPGISRGEPCLGSEATTCNGIAFCESFPPWIPTIGRRTRIRVCIYIHTYETDARASRNQPINQASLLARQSFAIAIGSERILSMQFRLATIFLGDVTLECV